VKIRHTLYLVSGARRPYSAPNTDRFGEVLKSLDVLEPSEAKIDLSQCHVAVADKAQGAECGRLVGMLASDALELIYLHLSSMRNFDDLARKIAMAAAA
jgi:hypothetical protein